MPWAKVLRGKYMSNRSSCSPWLSRGTCSRTWAACKAARPILDSGLRKVISSGNSTSFWNDAWTSFGTLRSVISGSLNFQEDQRSMLQAFLEYRMQHCFRETNKVADLLANIGRCQEDSFVSYVNPPFVVMEALNYDSNAVTHTIRTPIIFDY
ncbi:hypothetical protein CFP56_037460 [Quercus suber]|uniref:RNase H type-1 domain-containing protein n=1 Tax=Quercus suber TaxID=58331 RepID=A0AAW0LQB3_QUESU